MKTAISWTLLSSLFAAGSQLLLLFLLARFGDSEQLGIYSLSLLLITISGIFAESGVTQFYIQRQINTDTQRSSLFFLSLLSAAVPAIILVIATSLTEPGFREVLWLAAFIILLSGSLQVHQAELIKTQRFKALALLDLSWRVPQVLLGVPLLVLFEANALILLILMLIGYSIRAGLLLFAASLQLQPRIEINLIQQAIRFGYPLTLANIISLLRAQLDQIIVALVVGISELGLYSLAKELISSTHKLINSVTTRICFPKICLTALPLRRLQVTRIAAMLGWLNLAVHVGFSLLLALTYFFSGQDNFKISLVLYMLLAVYSVTRPTGLVNSMYAQSIARTEVELRWNLVSLINLLPLTVIALLSKNIFVIAASVSLIQLVTTCLSFRFFDRHLNSTLSNPLFIRLWLPVMLAAISSLSAVIIWQYYAV